MNINVVSPHSPRPGHSSSQFLVCHCFVFFLLSFVRLFRVRFWQFRFIYLTASHLLPCSIVVCLTTSRIISVDKQLFESAKLLPLIWLLTEVAPMYYFKTLPHICEMYTASQDASWVGLNEKRHIKLAHFSQMTMK